LPGENYKDSREFGKEVDYVYDKDVRRMYHSSEGCLYAMHNALQALKASLEHVSINLGIERDHIFNEITSNMALSREIGYTIDEEEIEVAEETIIRTSEEEFGEIVILTDHVVGISYTEDFYSYTLTAPSLSSTFSEERLNEYSSASAILLENVTSFGPKKTIIDLYKESMDLLRIERSKKLPSPEELLKQQKAIEEKKRLELVKEGIRKRKIERSKAQQKQEEEKAALQKVEEAKQMELIEKKKAEELAELKRKKEEEEKKASESTSLAELKEKKKTS